MATLVGLATFSPPRYKNIPLPLSVTTFQTVRHSLDVTIIIRAISHKYNVMHHAGENLMKLLCQAQTTGNYKTEIKSYEINY